MTARSRGNGEGSVYQVKSRGRRLRWCASIVIGWRDERPIRRARYASSRREALKALEDLRREHRLGLAGGDETVASYLRRWIASADLRPRTRVNYQIAAEKHLIEAIGGKRLAELRPADIRAAIAGIDRAAKTRANILGVLRSALADAERDGAIERNVAALVEPPRGQPHKRETLSAEQVRAFLDATATDRFRALYMLACATGMRQGEILGLRWTDIESARLHVRLELARIDGEYVLAPVKTKSSVRDIILPPSVVTALDAHRVRQDEERAAAGPFDARTNPHGWLDRGLVFCRPDGEALNARVVTKAFQASLAAAGLPKVTFHSLRHFAVTSMVSVSGGDLKMAQVVAGHSTIGVTADVYAHAVDEQLRRAAALMEEILGPTAVSTAVSPPI